MFKTNRIGEVCVGVAPIAVTNLASSANQVSKYSGEIAFCLLSPHDFFGLPKMYGGMTTVLYHVGGSYF